MGKDRLIRTSESEEEIRKHLNKWAFEIAQDLDYLKTKYGLIEANKYIAYLVNMNFRRSDYHLQGRTNGVDLFLQTKKFSDFFKELCRAKPIPNIRGPFLPNDIANILSSGKDLVDLIADELYVIGVVDLLPLLFQLKTPGALELLKRLYNTSWSTTHFIWMTSIPRDESSELQVHHLLNIYAKLSIIGEDIAYEMVEIILCSRKLTIKEVLGILIDIWVKCSQNGFRQQPEDDDSEGKKIKTDSQTALPPETIKLQMEFFMQLPQEVQNKILNIKQMRKRLGSIIPHYKQQKSS